MVQGRCNSLLPCVVGLSLAALLLVSLNRRLLGILDTKGDGKQLGTMIRQMARSYGDSDETTPSVADVEAPLKSEGSVSEAASDDGYCQKDCVIGKKKYRCQKAQPGEVNIILYGHHWEPINRDADTGRIENCPAKCNIRYRGWCDAAKADAAVINILWPSKTRPSKKPPGQRWVFYGGFETQYHKSGAKRGKDFIMGLQGKVDWTMGFGPRTDFYNPNVRVLPSNSFSGGPQTYEQGVLNRSWGEGKTDFMLWIVSNCNMATTRMTFYKEMEKFLPKKRMLVLGKCGEQSPCRSRKDADPCNQKLFSRFKFYYAAENGQCEGWITEKLTRGLQQGMVPVVFGPSRADYERLAPKDSFIHADDFDGSPKKLAAHLIMLDKDPVAYNRYFEWRSRGLVVFDTYFMYRRAYCELCQELHNT